MYSYLAFIFFFSYDKLLPKLLWAEENLNYMSRNHSGIKESQGTVANTQALEGRAVAQSACSLVLRLGCPSPLLSIF